MVNTQACMIDTRNSAKYVRLIPVIPAISSVPRAFEEKKNYPGKGGWYEERIRRSTFSAQVSRNRARYSFRERALNDAIAESTANESSCRRSKTRENCVLVFLTAVRQSP